MNGCRRTRFAAWLTAGVFLAGLGAEVGRSQTDAPSAVVNGTDTLTNLQELLRANLQLQEQLHGIELTLDQSLTNSQDLFRINLQLQEQLHSTRIALDQNQKEAEAAAARSVEIARNAEALATRLDQLEQDLAGQRVRELELIQSSNRSMLIVVGAFGSVALLIVLLTASLHRRTLRHFSAVPPARGLAPSHAVAQLGTGETALIPASQTDQSTASLLMVISRLEKRILELEHTVQPHQPAVGKTTPDQTGDAVQAGLEAATSAGTSGQSDATGLASRIAVLLGKGQSLLNLDQPEDAVACFDAVLQLDRDNAEALVRKGTALERLDSVDEAIACYDRAIAADRSLTMAYLRKGGVCNRMARYSEALACYEQALQTQEVSRAT